jgi:hypothetical protein
VRSDVIDVRQLPADVLATVYRKIAQYDIHVPRD